MKGIAFKDIKEEKVIASCIAPWIPPACRAVDMACDVVAHVEVRTPKKMLLCINNNSDQNRSKIYQN